MFSYLLNYKNLPPDKRPVFYNEQSSGAPTRKLLDRHVSVADGLRNGGSRTKTQPNISCEENFVMKKPVTGLKSWCYYHIVCGDITTTNDVCLI
jgi:hypothetical protein